VRRAEPPSRRAHRGQRSIRPPRRRTPPRATSARRPRGWPIRPAVGRRAPGASSARRRPRGWPIRPGVGRRAPPASSAGRRGRRRLPRLPIRPAARRTAHRTSSARRPTRPVTRPSALRPSRPRPARPRTRAAPEAMAARLSSLRARHPPSSRRRPGRAGPTPAATSWRTAMMAPPRWSSVSRRPRLRAERPARAGVDASHDGQPLGRRVTRPPPAHLDVPESRVQMPETGAVTTHLGEDGCAGLGGGSGILRSIPRSMPSPAPLRRSWTFRIRAHPSSLRP
jgi:hypothetical protein